MRTDPAVTTSPHLLPSWLVQFERLCAVINRIAEWFVGLLVAAMTLDIFVQVIFRYGVESSLSWSEELARYLFVWVIFVGSSVAVRRNQHIGMNALTAVLPERARIGMVLLSLAAFVGFMLLLGWVSLPLVANARFAVSSELQIPIAWVYAAAPVGAVLSVVHLINRALQTIWTVPVRC